MHSSCEQKYHSFTLFLFAIFLSRYLKLLGALMPKTHRHATCAYPPLRPCTVIACLGNVHLWQRECHSLSLTTHRQKPPRYEKTANISSSSSHRTHSSCCCPLKKASRWLSFSKYNARHNTSYEGMLTKSQPNRTRTSIGRFK